jgi:hypothetical protein
VKTVLFAWELGYGFGHVMNMRRIAAKLRPHGVRMVGVIRDVALAGLLRDDFDEIIAAPPWPLDDPSVIQRPRSSATLNDTLSSAGLADRSAVQRILSAWDEIIRRIRPDLMIADFSPLAGLTARGRIPLVHIGNGYTLPPHEMKRFPLLHRISPPVWNEEATLAIVNAAAATLALKPLEHLPQIFSGDICLVQTFPLLDPYDTQRTFALEGPMFEQPPLPHRADAQSIFVYLSAGRTRPPSIFDALAPFAERLRLHAPQWPQERLGRLAAAGAKIETEPQPLSTILASSRLVIHHGGPGVAAEALAAGVAQLVISTHIEQELYGEALQRAGVARFIKTGGPAPPLEAGAIQSVVADDTIAARAEEMGVRCRGFASARDALKNCETICMRLLGAGRVQP